jgi:hypothetical protein
MELRAAWIWEKGGYEGYPEEGRPEENHRTNIRRGPGLLSKALTSRVQWQWT